MKHDTQKMNRVLALTLLGIIGLNMPIYQSVYGQEELPDPLVENRIQYPKRKVPMVDPTRASWLQASVHQTPNDLIRSNWVMLGEGGELKGHLLGGTSDSIPMSLFALRRGLVVGQTLADSQGLFQMEGLSQGAYTFVGYTPNRFITFGLNLLEFQQNNQNLPTSITARPVNFRDKQPICKLVQENAPSVQFAVSGVYPVEQTALGQAAHFGWAGLSEFPVDASPATTLDSREIQLGPDGLLRGRIHQIDDQTGRPLAVSQTKVMLVEQGEVVVETACNRNGEFEFTGMPTGEFGLIAFGKDGFAALGLQLIRNHQNSPTAATTTNKMSVIDFCLIQPESTGWINHFLHENAYLEALAQPRPQKIKSGPCCIHCQSRMPPGKHCECHALVNNVKSPQRRK